MKNLLGGNYRSPLPLDEQEDLAIEVVREKLLKREILSRKAEKLLLTVSVRQREDIIQRWTYGLVPTVRACAMVTLRQLYGNDEDNFFGPIEYEN
jgi:hypothetical protein